MTDKNIFSKEYHEAQQRAAKLAERHEYKTLDSNTFELIAFLETNMPLIKRHVSKVNNYDKQALALRFVDRELYSIDGTMYKNKAIKSYLNKQGIFSPMLYVIIDLIITAVLSSLALIAATTLFGLELSLLVVLLWICVTYMIAFLLDLTTYMNFYKVK